MNTVLRGPEHTFRRVAAYLLVITVLFILYASLYPFEFDLHRLREAREGGWIHGVVWRKPVRSDLIANLIFYMPFGALATYLAPRRWGRLRRFLVAVGAGTSLSIVVETLQFATRTRDPALTDIVLNCLSTAIAAVPVLGARRLGLRPALPQFRTRRPDPSVLFLVALWLAIHAAPFMPTARFIRYFNDPGIVLGQTLSAGNIAGYFAGYVILGMALRTLLRASSFWPALAVAAALSLLARVLFRGQHLELDECVGLLIAMPVIWHLCSAYERSAGARGFAYAGIALAIFVLTPFDYSANAPNFQLLPDLPLALRTDAREPGWFEIAFLYGGVTWLAGEAGLPMKRVAPLLVIGALILEIPHSLQPGHTAHAFGAAIVILSALAISSRRAYRRWPAVR